VVERREQAFSFISYLNKKKYKKNIFSLDYLVTKLINKFFLFFSLYFSQRIIFKIDFSIFIFGLHPKILLAS
jgi:hypothetical protein